jgi:hypothetical protein
MSGNGVRPHSPPVYMLWKCPDALPSLPTWGAVLEKIFGGAGLPSFYDKGDLALSWRIDLMWPGVPGTVEDIVARYGALRAGQLVSVVAANDGFISDQLTTRSSPIVV